MNLEITCQQCHKHYLVKSHFAGRKVKCRHCQHAITVDPASTSAPLRAADDEPTADGTSDPLLNTLFECREPADDDTKVSLDWLGPADWVPPQVKVECHECGERYRAPEELAGQRVRCRSCGTAIRVPEPEATVTMFE